ncbi:hypothetical protein PV403_01705 [Paenibacillus sp. GYB006]|uniref:hypothetical protein n=1 Tax=Paenibacillus sp. GYB006 TaxID=2994394 RepID=UPI002F9653E2
MKTIISITAIVLLFVLSGCTNQEPLSKEEEIPSSTNNQGPTNPPTTELDDAKINLFADVSKYDGIAEKEIEISGEKYMTKFIKHDFLPVGFYVPDFINEKKFHDGNEFEGPHSSLISIFSPDQLSLDPLVMREELEVYQEYMGSQIHDGADQIKIKYEDFFRVNIEGTELVIRLSYFEDESKTVLPQFIDILKTLKYTE